MLLEGGTIVSARQSKCRASVRPDGTDAIQVVLALGVGFLGGLCRLFDQCPGAIGAVFRAESRVQRVARPWQMRERG